MSKGELISKYQSLENSRVRIERFIAMANETHSARLRTTIQVKGHAEGDTKEIITYGDRRLIIKLLNQELEDIKSDILLVEEKLQEIFTRKLRD